jgi:hypothetical protein
MSITATVRAQLLQIGQRLASVAGLPDQLQLQLRTELDLLHDPA